MGDFRFSKDSHAAQWLAVGLFVVIAIILADQLFHFLPSAISKPIDSLIRHLEEMVM
tara:strand:- start:57 stop:227 length:171 start_codon:yes stop_codon:yes gene_type:complete